MVSRPAPTSETPPALHRVALPPGDPRGGGHTGQAARGARDLAARIGGGLAVRLGEAGPEPLPVGLWPSTETEAAVDPVLLANPALAAYAARIRAKRDGGRRTPPRGLPLATRRQRSAAGSGTLPGGLARRAMPVDRPEDPAVTAIVRGARPGTATGTTPGHAPGPGARR